MFSSVLAAASLTVAWGKSALVIVDVQECFLPNGSLGVDGADSIISKIDSVVEQKSCLFDYVVRTQDYHPAGHISFASTHGLAPFDHLTLGKGNLPLTCISPDSGNTADASCCPSYYLNASRFDCTTHLCPADGAANWDYAVNMSDIITGNAACTICASNASACFETDQAMWTDHCIQTGDTTLSTLNVTPDAIIQKGSNKYVDAYSAFMDNSRNLQTTLDATMQAESITEIYVTGIATDVCVNFTVRDAIYSGTGSYTVKVISDACAGLSPEAHTAALDEFRAMDGVEVISTADVLAMSCPTTSGGGTEAAGTLALTMSPLAAVLSFLLAMFQ